LDENPKALANLGVIASRPSPTLQLARKSVDDSIIIAGQDRFWLLSHKGVVVFVVSLFFAQEQVSTRAMVGCE
jgi:hypothetical protein